MKKKINSLQKLIIILSLFVFVIGLSQCHLFEKKTKEDPYAKVLINPSFAKDPPMATNINITQLATPDESGNLLYEATLPKEKIKSNMLAVMLNDSDKIVLHDDGKNGDKVAGDGIYSTVMNVDIDSLRSYIAEKGTQSKRLLESKQQLFKFAGRLEFPVPKTELLSLNESAAITKEKINLQNSFQIIRSPIIPLLTAIPASFKHTALTVTDPSVVNDPSRTFNPCTNAGSPGGAWTFGKLMTDLANNSGVTPENFVLNWLNTWNAQQTVNGDVISPRTNINNIINNWHTLCGGPSAPLNVNKAPFKLLAIVNRFDLRSGGAYGGGNAGEGRFVFCATDAQCNLQLFFVIFEFGVNKTTCATIHGYAQQWVNLAGLPFPGAAYNNALQAITDQFAKAGTNPGKPNQSSLDQLRTNEIALGVFPWQLREFHIDAVTHLLFNVTTKREPQISFNSAGASPSPANVAAFGTFVNANMRTIINDDMDLPNTIAAGSSNVPFIAGKAHTLTPTAFHWDAVEPSGIGHIENDTARFHISFNTCSGCHGGDTHTLSTPTPFTQVGLPLSPAGAATMGEFLTGNPAFSSSPVLVPDRAGRPAGGTPILWPFNDLERRGRDLMDFVSGTCPTIHFGGVNSGVSVSVPFQLTKILTIRPVTMAD